MKKQLSRREFLKDGAFSAAALTAFWYGGLGELLAEPAQAPVYFTKDISPAGLRKLYEKVNGSLTGKVGIKLHTGEPNGPNLLPVNLIKSLQPRIENSSIVECNVWYRSPRQETAGHLQAAKTNGFDFCPVDIMDAEGDASLPVPGMKELLERPSVSPAKPLYTPGTHLTEVAVGKNLLRYDSLLVYTHFKGHLMGGFGGSLKNIAIGCASAKTGKQQVHGGWTMGPLFMERMAESGKATTSRFGKHIAYINVLKNISVDCDCDARGQKPTCDDIGILASTDLLAIEKASVDLVYALPEAQRKPIVERIESRQGLRQLEFMKTLGMGNDSYKLVQI